MSTKEPKFGLEINPINGGYKKGFEAVAKIGAGDFEELVLRCRLDGSETYLNIKDFDSGGSSTTCTVSVEDVERLWGKKPKFYAVARFEGAEKQESDEVEVDLS